MIIKLTRCISSLKYTPYYTVKASSEWEYEEILINPNTVKWYERAANDKGSVLYLIDGSEIYVKETLDDILKKMEEN